MSEHAPLTADQARAALAGADTARRGLTARGRWLAGYFGAFAVGSVVVVLLIGLGGDTGTTLAMIGWVLLVSLGVGYAATRPVRLRREGRLHALAWLSWGVVYAVALLGGHPRHGELAYWLPAALVTAVPLLATAVLALRWSRR
ncbi:hypothetical protein [Quadrisphaera setariae]|uniref:Uncharacterized protein n=1 Tax=Quadrisphaera setariae TaxID=2593304 RepID=A0A5C8ZEE1_9ACTN|nr:hypothetical protein [Quadrisphaera setariae]TXR55286.1 hypothetical protein FMM08_15575 [Quadrisphaera setariae]